MSFKVVRDAGGNVVAFGPNTDAYEPSQAYVIEQNVPIVAPSAQQLALKQSAQYAMDAADITMLRCVENGVTVPTAWATYRKALRAILNGTDTTSTTLPTRPAYPAGT